MHSVNMGNAILSARKINTPWFLIIQYLKKKKIFARLLKTYFFLGVCRLKNLNDC